MLVVENSAMRDEGGSRSPRQQARRDAAEPLPHGLPAYRLSRLATAPRLPTPMTVSKQAGPQNSP